MSKMPALDEDKLIQLASLVGTDAKNPEANLVAYVHEVLRDRQLALYTALVEQAVPNPTTPAGELEFVPLSVLSAVLGGGELVASLDEIYAPVIHRDANCPVCDATEVTE